MQAEIHAIKELWIMRHQYVFELKIYTVCCIYGISTTHKSDTKTLRIITLPYHIWNRIMASTSSSLWRLENVVKVSMDILLELRQW